MDQPTIDTRLNYNGYLGTIKYVGPVDGTKDIWLGIEWDDPQRGKHGGTKDGKVYFTCCVPKSGSFLRPSANVSYGQTFLGAMTSKYIEQLHGSGSQEKIILGSSDGTIQVEAVRLDKVRRKLAVLENLRQVSLDNENVAKADPPGTINKTCPNIRGLDLSMSLLPSWDVVAQITLELPHLERLSLSRNRLRSPINLSSLEGAFTNLTELQLNGTMTTWKEFDEIAFVMPKLKQVEMGYNRISHLATINIHSTRASSIELLNLDSNFCQDWIHICQSLIQYNGLRIIILTSNTINVIPPPQPGDPILEKLYYLSLSGNNISSWRCIDALAMWCPALKSLSLGGNPFVTNVGTAKFLRPFAIAKVPTLDVLDGTKISARERTDSELFYLSHAANEPLFTEEQRIQEHPQWSRLCQIHGRPEGHNRQGNLSQQQIKIRLCNCRPDNQDVVSPTTNTSLDTLSVLGKMTLRTLRVKICKMMKANSKQAQVDLWMKMTDGKFTTLQTEDDAKDLGWFGIVDETELRFQIRNK